MDKITKEQRNKLMRAVLHNNGINNAHEQRSIQDISTTKTIDEIMKDLNVNLE